MINFKYENYNSLGIKKYIAKNENSINTKLIFIIKKPLEFKECQ